MTSSARARILVYIGAKAHEIGLVTCLLQMSIIDSAKAVFEGCFLRCRYNRTYVTIELCCL